MTEEPRSSGASVTFPLDEPAYPFRRDRRCPLEPPPEFVLLRREHPVSRATLWNGQKVWLLTRYEDAQAALNDTRLSSVPANPGYPTLSPTIAASRRADTSFLRMDRPKHTEHRRMWTQFFSSRRIQEMRPGIEATVDRTLDRLAEMPQPADFVKHFALLVPSLVICQLLDVPEDRHAFFQRHSLTRMTMNGTPADILQAMAALDAFWESEIDRRERHPGDDIISRLIVTEVQAGHLTKAELRGMAQLMLLAGHETTANMIALGTLTLLRHPEALGRIKADPSLVPAAVEELLRYLTVAQHGLGRTAIADVEIGGQLIRSGEGVLVVVAAANRDESEFADPDRLDIDRPGVRRHVSFGSGIHQCIGHPLARAELQIVFSKLFARFPGLSLAVADEDIPYKYDNLFFGVHSLPVRW
ncbi:MAG TPA: cytochrome P450 [Hyphomicrobiales bacterium]|nr:cytochrome P450 [Hyphomicrobiales bacterium]